ncbi:MAG TPA: UPF0175 family protein [Tepidisphaeraceae bacterium]|jgi:predicted HTH domain antitoxin
MPIITLDLPADVFAALRRNPDEFAREMRFAAAVHWYTRGEISQSRAATVAGMTRVEFLDELALRKIEAFAVDTEGLRRELARG